MQSCHVNQPLGSIPAFWVHAISHTLVFQGYGSETMYGESVEKMGERKLDQINAVVSAGCLYLSCGKAIVAVWTGRKLGSSSCC